MFKWVRAFFAKRREQRVTASYHRVDNEWKKR
jgi:hypothetical protein